MNEQYSFFLGNTSDIFTETSKFYNILVKPHTNTICSIVEKYKKAKNKNKN